MMKIESPWLRHPRVWITLGIMSTIFTVAVWVFDRAPPSVFGMQIDTPMVAAGSDALIRVATTRNIGRHCSMSLSRSIVDRTHAFQILVPYQFVTAEGIEKRAEESPNFIFMRVHIPVSVVPGPAQIVTETKWTCPFNPTTWVLPIEHTYTVDLMVLPPDPSTTTGAPQ